MNLPPDLERWARANAIAPPVEVRIPTETTIREVPLAPETPECDFTARVIQYAQDHGWRVAHFRPAKTDRGWRTPVSGDGKGFFDLVLVRGEVLFVELKSMTGRLTKEQKDWRDAVRHAGSNYHLWTPADWPEITVTLG